MDFLEVVENRRSYRKFTDKKIDKKLLEKMVNIAIQSPTAMNKQNRIFTIIQNEKLIILVSAPKVNETLGIQDTAIALDHLYLASTYFGLGSCWINQFKEAKSDEYIEFLREINIPQDHIVYAGMVVGFADEVPKENPRNEEIRFI